MCHRVYNTTVYLGTSSPEHIYILWFHQLCRGHVQRTRRPFWCDAPQKDKQRMSLPGGGALPLTVIVGMLRDKDPPF